MSLDGYIVIAYLMLTVGLGMLVARNLSSAQDFKTGGRQYSSWAVFATLSASFIGGGFTIGLAEKTYSYGLLYIIGIWGFSLKEILIATFIAPRLAPFRHILTVGDIMHHAYGKLARLITGIASILVCGGIIGAQISACGNLLETFLGLPHAWGSILATSCVIIYSTMGGMKSVIAVDILHFAVLSIMLPLVFVFGSQALGHSTWFNQLPTEYISLNQGNMASMIILFASFFLGETLIPPYFQRLLIGKDIKTIIRGTLASGILSIPFFLLMGGIGMMAYVLDPHIPAYSALPKVIDIVMPVGFKGLAIAALLAVIMSSADSFLNSTATSSLQDILIPLQGKPKTELQELRWLRLLTVMIGSIALISALSSKSVLDLLLYAYQFWTPCILMPLIAALMGIRASEKVFFTAFIAGASSVLGWNLLGPSSYIEGALEAVIIGVLINSLVFWLSYKLYKTQSLPDLEAI